MTRSAANPQAKYLASQCTAVQNSSTGEQVRVPRYEHPGSYSYRQTPQIGGIATNLEASVLQVMYNYPIGIPCPCSERHWTRAVHAACLSLSGLRVRGNSPDIVKPPTDAPPLSCEARRQHRIASVCSESYGQRATASSKYRLRRPAVALCLETCAVCRLQARPQCHAARPQRYLHSQCKRAGAALKAAITARRFELPARQSDTATRYCALCVSYCGSRRPVRLPLCTLVPHTRYLQAVQAAKYTVQASDPVLPTLARHS